MTVQISITVWTILCLVALMLILNRFLFRPLLSFMDRRNDKIRLAKEEKETALQERETEIHRLEEAQEAALRSAAAEAAASGERIREQVAGSVAEAKELYYRKLQEEKDLLAQEAVSIQEQLTPHMGELAELFTGKLLSWQEDMTISSEAESSAPQMDAAAMAAISAARDLQDAPEDR